MKLDSPIYLERIETDRPGLVWVNPCVTSMMLERLPIVKVTDTDQLLEIYGKLNKMRIEAEAKAREAERRAEKRWHEVKRLKAIIYNLTGGAE